MGLGRACSSLMPPLRKLIVGTATGIVCWNTRTVAAAIACALHSPFQSAPGRTMLGFRMDPSSRMWWSLSALYVAASTRSVTAALTSIGCAPSMSTSGSTMGARPLAWQMAAYRARPAEKEKNRKTLGDSEESSTP